MISSNFSFTFKFFPPTEFYFHNILKIKIMSSLKSGKRHNHRDISKVIKDTASKDNDIYTVEAILNKKKEGENWKYLIKWYGWPKSQATWEPLENIDNIMETVEKFNKTWDEENKSEKDKKGENKKEIETVNQKSAEKSKSSIKKSLGRKRIEHTPNPNKKVKSNKAVVEESVLDITQPLQGHFKFGDKAKRIVSAKSEEPYVICTIDWEIRSDGTLPLRTNLTNKEIKEHDPLLLLEFYESRLKFGSSGNVSNKEIDPQIRSAIVNFGNKQTQEANDSVLKRNLFKDNKADKGFSDDETNNNIQKTLSQNSRKQ